MSRLQASPVVDDGSAAESPGGAAVPENGSMAEHTTPRLARWCADLLVTAEWSGSQLVLRTPAGAAQMLAGAVDDAMLPGVLGCIAGDDTVLVVTRSERVASGLAAHLLSLAEPGARRGTGTDQALDRP